MNILKKLSDTIRRKFVEIFDCSMWQIESDQGWTDIDTINKTEEYQRFIIKFESGNTLECADNHIIITEDYDEVFIILDKMDKIGAEGVAKELNELKNFVLI